MKVQLCLFRRDEKDLYENGLAFVKCFGFHDVDKIIDSQGIEVTKVWDYRLLNLPLSFIDSEYRI